MKKLLALILVAVMICSLTACGKEKTFDLNNCLKVEFSGTNGSGQAIVTSFADFREELIASMEGEASLMELEMIASAVYYQLDKTSGLSNGDKVKLTIIIDDKIEKISDVKLIGQDMEFTVSGLK